MKIIIDKIKLCSINKRDMVVKMGKYYRICKSGVYRESETELINAIRTQMLLDKIESPKYGKNIEVKIEIWTYKDISNCLKMIEDVLQTTDIIKNDRYITKEILVKHPLKRGSMDKLVIEVQELDK